MGSSTLHSHFTSGASSGGRTVAPAAQLSPLAARGSRARLTCASWRLSCHAAPGDPVRCAQLDAALVAADARWHLQRSYQVRLAGGRAELFFFDTCPFVQKYYEAEWADRVGAQTSTVRVARIKAMKAVPGSNELVQSTAEAMQRSRRMCDRGRCSLPLLLSSCGYPAEQGVHASQGRIPYPTLPSRARCAGIAAACLSY